MMRYIIGIDLGTTNCCVSYVDTESDRSAIIPFKIPQLSKEGVVEALSTLPSFCYLAAPHEWPPRSLDLPWKQTSNFFVGSFALTHGERVSTRLVQSAKSWLCHSAANRRDKILPIEAAEESIRISPIEGTARYLAHIKEAWDDVIARGDSEKEFENQEVILTVPASFDEVARSLTVEAARLAGFQKMTLLEEPQAAFYSWISQYEAHWEKKLHEGACILVCDVGGGTTDFSLIHVVSQNGKPAFQRMAVGNHLLLGGDNMDAAIAHYLENKWSSGQKTDLSSMQCHRLKHESRKAKELLLTDPSVELHRIILQGSGSGVVGGTLSIDISQSELKQFLLKGFFGQYSWEEALKLRKTSGLRNMGLPYEDEPSITKHLASFLNEKGVKKIDFVLFNGGAMKPQLFQETILNSLTKWFPETKPEILPSYNLDLAVARGAAYYGKVRRGLGVKIGGGMARSYYLVCDVKDPSGKTSRKALTLLSRGFEEGSLYEPEQPFLLNANTPVTFQLCSSHIRIDDQQGELVAIDPHEMQMLPPVHTVLKFGSKQLHHPSGEKIPVQLQISATSIGTLEMFLNSIQTEHRWSLDFQLRTAQGQDNSLAALEKGRVDQTFQEGFVKDAERIILQFFSKENKIKPEKLMEKLEQALGMAKLDWPPSVMRCLSETALKLAPFRKISKSHESRWWNLIGFLLRPGFGYPLDDFRLKELWKVMLSDRKNPKTDEVQLQVWICYRRVAGGLSKGQQAQLISDLLASLQNEKEDICHYSEKIRSLASMELMENTAKIKLGNALISSISKGEAPKVDFWALGRIGARHLLYGSPVNVVPSAVCGQWVETLLKTFPSHEAQFALLIGQLARKVEQRELNLPQKTIDEILNHFDKSQHFDYLHTLLTQEQRLAQSEMEQAFGEALPSGLMLEEKR